MRFVVISRHNQTISSITLAPSVIYYTPPGWLVLPPDYFRQTEQWLLTARVIGYGRYVEVIPSIAIGPAEILASMSWNFDHSGAGRSSTSAFAYFTGPVFDVTSHAREAANRGYWIDFRLGVRNSGGTGYIETASLHLMQESKLRAANIPVRER